MLFNHWWEIAWSIASSITGNKHSSSPFTPSPSLPIISLNYTTLQAAETRTNSAGAYHVFRNIRFAAPPVGDLRWAAPQEPVLETEMNNGTSPGVGTEGCALAEDCLFLDVWAPANAIEQGASLPVVFWNYGGGWVFGSKNDPTPEGLLEMSSNGFVFVAYNYRVDIMGVLNGPTLQRSGGVSNVAVYDARKALEWTNRYISKFGGDPDTVINWGFSAGGSQVLVALTAFGGHDWKPLFKRAIINSPGWVPGAGHAQPERFLRNVTEHLGGCDGPVIPCLRNVSFDDLMAASREVRTKWDYQMQPRVDGVVLPDTSEYLLGIRQAHPDIEVMLGNSAHEAKARESAEGGDAFRARFKTIFPSITDWAIDQVVELYPESEFKDQDERLGAVISHYDLAGKILPTTNFYNNKTFNYINHLGDASHGSDQPYWWYKKDTNSTVPVIKRQFPSGPGGPGGPDGPGGPGGHRLPESEIWIAERMQQHLIAFIQTGDPSIEAYPWPMYGEEGNVLSISSDGFAITGDSLDNDQVTFWNQAYWY